MANACSIHPHPGGQSEFPHNHGFLSDLAQAFTDGVAPALPVPARLLIAAALVAALSFLFRDAYVFHSGWVTSPDPPPPRFSLVVTL
jgi:hypothetical protein